MSYNIRYERSIGAPIMDEEDGIFDQELKCFTEILKKNPQLTSIKNEEKSECKNCKKSITRIYSEYIFRNTPYISFKENDHEAIICTRNQYNILKMFGKCSTCSAGPSVFSIECY